MIKHCDYLECVKPFSFRVEGQRGRPINVKAGDLFWNTTADYMQKRDGVVKLARKGKNMDYSYPFNVADVLEHFAVVS